MSSRLHVDQFIKVNAMVDDLLRQVFIAVKKAMAGEFLALTRLPGVFVGVLAFLDAEANLLALFVG